MIPYIIVGAALIVIGVLWLSLYIFTSRKTTVETTDINPLTATDADIVRLEEAQRKLRAAYIRTAVNMFVPCLFIGVGIFCLAVAVVCFAGLI
mgnify:CR=1 FL=1